MTNLEKLIYFIITIVCIGMLVACAVIDTATRMQEMPEIEQESENKPHSLVRRLNYTYLFENAPKSTQSEITASPTLEPTPEPTAEPTAEPTPEPTPTKLKFLATAYSSDPKENGIWGAVDCKYGKPLPENALAAELDILPYGTKVYIEGWGERIVVDTAGQKTITRRHAEALDMGAIGWIDIYVGDEVEKAHEWGVRIVELTVLEWGQGK